MLIRILSCLILSTAFVISAVPAGYAGTIKVCSKYKVGKCVVGKTRKTAAGEQVRAPGGTWLNCKGDCSERLRLATVDFWKNQMLTQ
jgi:hypothetical protein